MNIKRVKYKMAANENWKVGYVIGAYDGQNETLLNDKFEYVRKIVFEGKEYLVYDIKDDIETLLNITLPI